MEDDVYRVGVVGQRVAARFGGREAAAEHRFLVLEVAVENTGKENGEFFQPRQQLKVAGASGTEVELAEATFDGPYAPADPLWVPPSERRTFEVAFQLPAGETRPRLAFTGVSKAEVLDLPPLDRAAPAEATDPSAAPPQAPPVEDTAAEKPAAPRPGVPKRASAAKFCTHCGAKLPPTGKFCPACGAMRAGT